MCGTWVVAAAHRQSLHFGPDVDGLALGCALHGLEPGEQVNLTTMMLFDPAMRELFPDWHAEAVKTSAYVRMAAARLPDVRTGAPTAAQGGPARAWLPAAKLPTVES